MGKCLRCGKSPKRSLYTYCSNKCQQQYAYEQFVANWRAQSLRKNNIVTSVNGSNYIRRYLIQKYNESCSLCGWNMRHPVTGVVPLEVDHIDGDATNNLEDNVRVVCPNCHALTVNFRNLNKGKGRIGRKTR